MHVIRQFKGVAVVALTAIGASLALAGPMAGTALAAKPLPTPPITGLSGPQRPTSASASATFSWDVASSTTYTCSLDGRKPQACSPSTATYTALADGAHTFVLKAQHASSAGVRYKATSANWSWSIDTVPPASPTITQLLTTSSTLPDINFTSDQTAKSFRCQLDELTPTATTLVAQTDCASPWSTSVPGTGTYRASVWAIDAVGNTSAPAHMDWTVDATSPDTPSVHINQAPLTNQTVMDAAFSTSEPSTFTCSLDGAPATACPNPAHFAGPFTEGAHTLTVVATDTASNKSNPGTAGWFIDLTAPSVAILSGPASTTNQTTASFIASVSDPSATLECNLDNVGFVPCPVPLDYSGLNAGAHTFALQATDTAGNATVSSTYNWSIDTSAPPPAYFLSGPSDPSGSATATFDWDASDPTVTTGFACVLDGQAWPPAGAPSSEVCDPTTAPVSISGLADGSHVLAVSALNGTAASAAVTYGWHVDTHAPTAPVFSTTPATNSTTSVFSFASDPGVQFTCSLDGAAAQLCASPVTFYDMSAGAHTFTVWATDLAGNSSHSDWAWTIDTSAPAAPTVTAPTGFSNNNSPALSWTDADSSLVSTSTVCSLDGQTLTSCPMDTAIPAGPLADGPHSFSVTVANLTGHSATRTVPWTVDTVAPVLHTGNVPTGVVASTDVAPDISQDETNPGTVTCDLKRAGVTVSTDCGPYVGLVDGAYTLTAGTSDVAGNAAVPVVTTWTVDTTAPVLSVSNLPSGTTGATSATPVVTQTDANPGPIVCSLTGPKSASDCGPYSNLPDGDYTFAATTTDLAGNVATRAVSAWTVKQLVTAPVAGPVDPAPTASLSMPTTLTGVATATFSETVHALAAGGASIVLTGTSTIVPTNVVCLSGTAAVACSGSFAAVRLTSRRALVPGQHYTLQLAAGAAQDSAGNPSVGNAAAFRGSLAEQENSAAARATWATVKATAAYGHSFVRQSLAGATATYTFRGTNVTWWTVTGKDQGKATVFIDGIRKAYVDNYTAATHFKVARRYTRLGNKTHTLRIVVRGLKGARGGTGTFVTVDAFSVGKTRANTPALVMTWRSAVSSHYSARHAAVARYKNETFSFTFRGTAVSWFTRRGVNQGKVAVYVDGVRKGVVDNYAARTAFGVKRSVTRLADKEHTLKLVVLGTHHKGATGTWVTVDRFQVT